MSKEEKEAIEVLKQIRYSLYVEEYFYEWQLAIDTILNYIDKLQKEIDTEKGYHSELQLRYNIEHDVNQKLRQENEELKSGLDFRVRYCKKLEQELYGGDFEETLVEKKYFVSKDKLLEVLRIDKDEEERIYNTEERILNLIDTILEEVERLEGIEDKMLLKCVSKDKIKAKIKELEELIEQYKNDKQNGEAIILLNISYGEYAIRILEELLEE